MLNAPQTLSHRSPGRAKILFVGILSVAVLSGLVLSTSSNGQESSPTRPSVINSTYATTDVFDGAITVHLHEEDGQLTKDEKSKDGEDSESVKYANVNYVGIGEDSLKPDGKKRYVHIEASDGNFVGILFRTESAAKAVAEYVGRKSGLEFIGDAWRVRKPFTCPDGGHLGCKSFKELLDHDDLDIVEYFYSHDSESHTYACFSGESEDFFVLLYSHLPLTKAGDFRQESFHEGQSIGANIASIDWFGADLGQISTDKLELKPGQKPQVFGSINPSSLVFERKSGTINYSLNVRWSTGRYSERFSEKGDKGKVTDGESSGVCSKLN